MYMTGLWADKQKKKKLINNKKKKKNCKICAHMYIV